MPTAFELIEQAKDFVLSKIDLWTGDRSQGAQVPTAYEIPQEVVTEAIVNAARVKSPYKITNCLKASYKKSKIFLARPPHKSPHKSLSKSFPFCVRPKALLLVWYSSKRQG